MFQCNAPHDTVFSVDDEIRDTAGHISFYPIRRAVRRMARGILPVEPEAFCYGEERLPNRVRQDLYVLFRTTANGYMHSIMPLILPRLSSGCGPSGASPVTNGSANRRRLGYSDVKARQNAAQTHQFATRHPEALTASFLFDSTSAHPQRTFHRQLRERFAFLFVNCRSTRRCLQAPRCCAF